MFRTIFFFPATSMPFNFSRRELLSSPRTMRPSSDTTDTPSTSLSINFRVMPIPFSCDQGEPRSLAYLSRVVPVIRSAVVDCAPGRGVRFSSTASIAQSLRSRCGSSRTRPESNRHLSPPVAPHVGHGTASKSVGVMSPILIQEGYYEGFGETVLFGTHRGPVYLALIHVETENHFSGFAI